MKRFSFRIVKDVIAYFLFRSFLSIMRMIGINRAANFCGLLFKLIGPLIPSNKIIRNNLRYIYKDITETRIEELEKKIWDNFGRYIGEFAFINKDFIEENIARIEVEGLDNIQHLIDSKKPFIIFSGHFANWDFVLIALKKLVNDMSVIYRKINNKLIDKYVRRKRSIEGVHLIKKGNEGVKDLIKSIKNKQTLVLLADQKMNEGIKVPFMGRSAMTSQAIAVLARQYDYPIVPGRIIRKDDGRYKIIFYKAFYSKKTSDKDSDIYETMKQVNDIIASWVFENPEQWFWMHQRWGKPREMEK